jgi:hypothetical protein
MWRHVTGKVVPDILREHSAFIFSTFKYTELLMSHPRRLEFTAVESELEGILGGVGVRKNVPTPTPTSIENLK